MESIIPRILLSTLIISVAAIAWAAVRNLVLKRAKNAASELDEYRRGAAALVYFSSPRCAPCKAIQRPAVERFMRAVGDSIQIIEVDTMSRPDIAERWGVFSTPTTVFVDTQGRPRIVNPGIATAETLLEQARGL
jgi:thiol-disulfide isomerase/thioredoxin